MVPAITFNGRPFLNVNFAIPWSIAPIKPCIPSNAAIDTFQMQNHLLAPNPVSQPICNVLGHAHIIYHIN